MDQHTVRDLVVCSLFAGIFIVVPIVYLLVRSQLKIANLVHRSQSTAPDAFAQERIAALEQRVAQLEKARDQANTLVARIAE